MLKERYVYPAILTIADDGISVEFPDLPGCLPCGTTIEEAIKNSKEALALHIHGLNEEGMEVPEARDPSNIHLRDGQVVYLVDVFMPEYEDIIISMSAFNEMQRLLRTSKQNDLHEIDSKEIREKRLKRYNDVT